MIEIPDHVVELAGKAVNDAYRERAKLPEHIEAWETLEGEPRDACIYAGRRVLTACWDEITELTHEEARDGR